MSFNGEFPYICESWYLLCPNITKTSLILVHLYSLFFNVFRFFQILFQRVQTCSNMFWFWRCLSVRRHPGVVSCSNIGIWYSKNITKKAIRCAKSHTLPKKRGDFFFKSSCFLVHFPTLIYYTIKAYLLTKYKAAINAALKFHYSWFIIALSRKMD